MTPRTLWKSGSVLVSALMMPCVAWLAAAQTNTPHVLIVVDQGQLSRNAGPEIGESVDRLVATVKTRATVETIVSSGGAVVRTDVVRTSLSGPTGFLDDLRNAHGISLAEAREVLRGNDSVRSEVSARRCAERPGPDCGAVHAVAKAASEQYQQLAQDSLQTLTRAIAAHCRDAGQGALVVLVTPGPVWWQAPDRQLQDLNKDLRGCAAALVVAQVDDGAGVKAEKALTDLRRNGVNALVKATGATVRPLSSVSSEVTERLDRFAPAPAAITPADATASRAAASLPGIVLQASTHVASFVEAASIIVADEHYVQEIKQRVGASAMPRGGAFGVTVEKRVLESEVALVHVLDQQLWLMGRDVLAVDNRRLADAQRVPLSAYHPSSMTQALQYFQQLATQSARYNIGIRRNLNTPTLALWLLTPGIRERFAFSLGGEERIDGRACQIVEYREDKQPYLLNADGRAVPARGRFWIEPRSGAVIKTELTLYDENSRTLGGATAHTARALITVRYAYADSVSAWVPLEMQERYDFPTFLDADFIVTRADYRGFKKFSVETKIVR